MREKIVIGEDGKMLTRVRSRLSDYQVFLLLYHFDSCSGKMKFDYELDREYKAYQTIRRIIATLEEFCWIASCSRNAFRSLVRKLKKSKIYNCRLNTDMVALLNDLVDRMDRKCEELDEIPNAYSSWCKWMFGPDRLAAYELLQRCYLSGKIPLPEKYIGLYNQLMKVHSDYPRDIQEIRYRSGNLRMALCEKCGKSSLAVGEQCPECGGIQTDAAFCFGD